MSKIRILLADDDPFVRQVFVPFLGDVYEVVEARDGLEAWKLIQETKPRLLVTDLNMPGLNGLELTEKVRSNPDYAPMPVIILTGTTQGTDLPGGFWRIGTSADLFLEKPISPDDLLSEVRRMLLKKATPKALPPGKGHY